jgi:replicative DNA helicase
MLKRTDEYIKELENYINNYNYLISDSDSLNKALNKGFLFGTATLFAGMGGVGKSYFLTQLKNNFLNLEQNKAKNIHILNFSSSVTPTTDIMRLVANKLKISYNLIHNAHYNRVTKVYEKRNENQIEQIRKTIIEFKTQPIHYFENEISIKTIEENVITFREHNPNIKNLVIILDELFSFRKDGERDDFEFANNLGQLINRLKKLNCLVIATTKLNNNIQSVERIAIPKSQYPIQTDVYNGNYFVWAFNNAFVIHRPELIGIKQYGELKQETADLVHLRKIKTNEGTIGDVWLKNVLYNGHFEPLGQMKKNFQIM